MQYLLKSLPATNLAAVTSCLAAAFLVGCGENGSEVAKVAPPASSKVVNIITWEDYVSPEVIEAFAKRTGIEVNLTTFETPEDLIGKLSAYSNRYDLVIFDNASVHRVADMKLLREIDKERLPGMSNLAQKFLDMDSDPGNQFTVPYLWGSTLVAYRKDKISNPEESFSLLFDPKPELKGRIMMIEDPVELFGVAHIYQGRSTNSYDEKSLRSAADLLRRQAVEVGAILGSDKDVRDGLASGNIWAAMCYSGDAAWVAEDHEEVGYFFPKEGATLWLDIMAITRDARNVDAAYSFIDFILEPEIGALNANSLWYATPNEKAMALLSEDLLGDAALIPPTSVIQRCEFLEVTPEHAMTRIGRLLRGIDKARPDSVSTVSTIELNEAE